MNKIVMGQLAETDHTVSPHGHAGTVNTTNKIDMNAWMKLPRVTNSIYGYNDGTWGQVRKKVQRLRVISKRTGD